MEDEEQDEDFACARRLQTDGLPQSHFSQASRIERHDTDAESLLVTRDRPLTLYSLPSKIHNAIFANLDDPVHVLCLSLTNRLFWAIGLSHIENHIMRSLAPWAGERILCISDRTDPNDLPPGLLNPTGQAQVRELNQIYTFDSFSVKDAWKKIGGPSLSKRLQDWFQKYLAKHPMSDADRNEIISGLKPEISDFSQPWILRNLTAKEYVRGEVIALKNEFIHGPQIDVFGFAEVLIARICWSHQPAELGKINIARGKWAGHCFDIIPLSIHEQRSDRSDWRDVSDEVFRELDLIMTAQKGDDWREHLSREYQKTTTPVPLGYI